MVYTWGLLQLTVAGLLAGYSKVVVHGLYLGTATVAGLLAGYSKVVVHGLHLGTATVAGLLAGYSKVVVNLIFYSLYICAPAISLSHFHPYFSCHIYEHKPKQRLMDGGCQQIKEEEKL